MSSSSMSLSVTSVIGFNTLTAHRACIPIQMTRVSKGTQSGSVHDTSVTITCTLSEAASVGKRFNILVSIIFAGVFEEDFFFFDAKLISICPRCVRICLNIEVSGFLKPFATKYGSLGRDGVVFVVSVVVTRSKTTTTPSKNQQPHSDEMEPKQK
jgi:hypothetical protein